MTRMILWEFIKIIENKLLWIVFLISILFAILVPGPSERYFQTLDIYKQYPGELSKYYAEMHDVYKEYEAYFDTCVKQKIEEKESICSGTETKNKIRNKKMVEYQTLKYIVSNIEESTKATVQVASMVGDSNSNPIFNQFDYDLEDTEFGNKVLLEKNNKIKLYQEEVRIYASNNEFLSNYHTNYTRTMVLIVACLIVGLIPVFMSERLFKTNSIITPSKVGRSLVISKIVATSLFALMIFSILYGIHVYRFGVNAGIGYYWNNPLASGGTYPKLREMSFSKFFTYYSAWGFLLTLFSSFIILIISKYSKHMILGLCLAALYFVYPYIYDYLNVKFEPGIIYILKYLNLAAAIRYTENFLLFGNSSYTTVTDYIYWGRDVLLYHSITLTFLSTAMVYYSLKKENIN